MHKTHTNAIEGDRIPLRLEQTEFAIELHLDGVMLAKLPRKVKFGVRRTSSGALEEKNLEAHKTGHAARL
jgi:hypothetical protein